MGLFSKVLLAGEGRKLKALQGLVPEISALEPEMERRSDAELRALTDVFRARLDAVGPDLVADREARIDALDDLLPEAFALVREAGKRTLGQRHFDVQLMGGAALHYGWVAEMKTGEGKTLVATLPSYLNALAGCGVHLVTVNDYLAKRDAEWMGRLHRFLGLEVGMVLPDMDDWDVKRAAYAADITYGTNNEFGFDYLRDNMASDREQQVQRQSADQLHVEMPHLQRAARSLTHHCKGLGLQLVERGASGELAAKLVGLGAQLGVAQCLQRRLEGQGGAYRSRIAPHQPFVAAAKHSRQGLKH